MTLTFALRETLKNYAAAVDKVSSEDVGKAKPIIEECVST